MTLKNDGGSAKNIARNVATAMTEKQWLARLIQLAREDGWITNHVCDQRAYARRTTRGWPDLECLRERLIFIEAKRENGKVSADQQRIIALLKAAGQEVYVWRPSDEDQARVILHRRVRA